MIPFPDKKYSIIYADPPWGYQNKGTRAAASKHYNTMTLEQIKQMPISAADGIAGDDCALFMWATFPMLREALEVIEAWGFTYKTIAFNWVKQNKSGVGLFWGLGNWTRSNSEICLLAVKGKPKRISGGVHSVVLSPVQRHSKKPDEVRERIIKLMGDQPRIELFAREPAAGWDSWGNELPVEKEETDDTAQPIQRTEGSGRLRTTRGTSSELRRYPLKAWSPLPAYTGDARRASDDGQRAD